MTETEDSSCVELCMMCQEIQDTGKGCCRCGTTEAEHDEWEGHDYVEIYDEKCDGNHGEMGFHVCRDHRLEQEREDEV